jgi:NAD(P) transhydrogenase subunit alpha
MQIAVAKETYPGERRVALIPPALAPLAKAGIDIAVQSGAGQSAGFPDADYESAGAKIVADRSAVFEAEIVLQVRALGANLVAGRADLELMRDGQTIVGTGDPLGAPQAAQEMAQKGVTLFALELIPRITRAQSMDVLSSQATIAGYRAVLLGAASLPKMFPMMMTAAGTLAAAKVFVIGAGVAGLQAIATARRLGGIVSAYDVRPAVREQVESLGGRFVELELETGQSETKGGYAKAMDEEFYRKQRELMARVVAESDVVITTAAIPGRQSPLLVTAAAVEGMQPGSVIVDLAAERGGNCELSEADQQIERHGVTILGPTNLPAEIPQHASQMFAKNIATLLLHLTKDGALHLDLEDEITRETMAAHGGEVTNARMREILGLKPLAKPKPDPEPESDAQPPTDAAPPPIPFDDDDADESETQATE